MTVQVHPIHAGPRMTFAALAASTGLIGFSIALAVARASGWWVLGVFLLTEIAVYVSFAVLIRRRHRDLALLRCFGASRGQVFRGVVVEAAWVGLFGAVLGLVAALVTQDVPGADITLFALITGIGGAVIAALVPAYRASRVPPARPPR